MYSLTSKSHTPKLLSAAFFHRNRWIRRASVVALCLLLAIPVGLILGLLGAVLGTAAILGILVAYGMLRSLTFGLAVLVGVVLLLPFAALPVDIGFAPTLLDMVLLGVFFVWISRVAAHKDEEFRAMPPTLGVLVFVLLAIFSFIAGLGHASLTPNVLRHFVEILLTILLFMLVINAIRTPEQLRVLTLALILAGAAAALIGVVLYMLPEDVTVRLLSTLRVVRYPSGSDVLRYIEDDPTRPMRATSTSVDPNVLGGALIFVTTITTSQIFAKAPVLPRRSLVGLSLMMAVCLILTFSRSSFLGLAVAIFGLAFLRYRRLMWIGLIALAVLFLLPQSQAYVQHFLSGVRGEDLATRMRFGEYKDALILIGRHPWFGVGFAGTPDVDTYLGVSNVYLLIAENMGVVGLAAFLGVLITYLARVIKVLLSSSTRSTISATTLGYFLAILGAMVGGMLDHYLFNLVFPHASALLWLTLGLGTVSLHLDMTKASTHAETAPSALWRALTSPSG